MAERRMFSKQVVRSDAFLDMPRSTRLLYYDLNLDADDDGFVDKYKSIMRLTGASEDDFKLLVAKRFVIIYPSGVMVVKHWKMNNIIRSDRYKPTVYQEEKRQLLLKENGAYSEVDTIGIPSDYQRYPQDSIGKYKEERMKEDIYINNKQERAHACEIENLSDDELISKIAIVNAMAVSEENLTLLEELQKEYLKRHKWRGKAVINSDGNVEELKSYEEVIKQYFHSSVIVSKIFAFIKHCNAGGCFVTNDKLEDLCFRLSEIGDETLAIRELDNAIRMGYYDIKVGK